MSGPENSSGSSPKIYSPYFAGTYSGNQPNPPSPDNDPLWNCQPATSGRLAGIGNEGNILRFIELETPTSHTSFGATNLTAVEDGGTVGVNHSICDTAVIPRCGLTGMGSPVTDGVSAPSFGSTTANTVDLPENNTENSRQTAVNTGQLLDQAITDLNVQPTSNETPTGTPEDVLAACGHGAPLPRAAFLIFIRIFKRYDQDADFYKGPDGTLELSPIDNRPIRIFNSLPRRMDHKHLNPRLHVRAELEGAEIMRDVIGRTDCTTIPNVKDTTRETESVKNDQNRADGENLWSGSADGLRGEATQSESNMTVQMTPTATVPKRGPRTPEVFRLPEHRLERMLSNAKQAYTVHNHLGLLSTCVFKNHARTVLSKATIEKLGGKTPEQWLFNTTQLIDLHPNRMCLIVPMEDVGNTRSSRPIGKPLPRTLYPLPMPQRLCEDAVRAYRILHPDRPLPDYDQLLRDHPHLATYDDEHHHFFGSRDTALQEGKSDGSECVFQAIDQAAARGERFCVSKEDDDLLQRAFTFNGYQRRRPRYKPWAMKRPAATDIEELLTCQGNEPKKARTISEQGTENPHLGDDVTADSFLPSNTNIVEAWLHNTTADPLTQLAIGRDAFPASNDAVFDPYSAWLQATSITPSLAEPFDDVDIDELLLNFSPSPTPYSQSFYDENQLQYTTPMAAEDEPLSLDNGQVPSFTDLLQSSLSIDNIHSDQPTFETPAADMASAAVSWSTAIDAQPRDIFDDINGEISLLFGDTAGMEAATGDPGAFSASNSFLPGSSRAAVTLSGADATLAGDPTEHLDMYFDL